MYVIKPLFDVGTATTLLAGYHGNFIILCSRATTLSSQLWTQPTQDLTTTCLSENCDLITNATTNKNTTNTTNKNTAHNYTSCGIPLLPILSNNAFGIFNLLDYIPRIAFMVSVAFVHVISNAPLH
jgi:hypothetical protein